MGAQNCAIYGERFTTDMAARIDRLTAARHVDRVCGRIGIRGNAAQRLGIIHAALPLFAFAGLPDGTDSHAPASIRFAQAIHHGTDHRSQVCTALTTLGIEPPEVDVWDSGRQDGRVFTNPTAG